MGKKIVDCLDILNLGIPSRGLRAGGSILGGERRHLDFILKRSESIRQNFYSTDFCRWRQLGKGAFRTSEDKSWSRRKGWRMDEMDCLERDEKLPVKKLWACLPAGPLERLLRWGGRRGK